ncbi:nucleotidyltransferase family protein [Hellea sp.]|nr:nucleotidyltransferase family protein [Hellea sp.]
MSVSVLILAGQREGVVDPLCAAAGVERKAIIPINGKPMINYVLDALNAAKLKTPFHVSGFDAQYDARLTQSPSAPGPAGSAYAALTGGISYPCLVTTCDHPLLTAKMIEIFISKAQESGADFCVGLAPKSVIAPAYPDTQRTYWKFCDTPVSGCNLFYMANEKGLAVIEFWKEAQHLRKQPLKLARTIAWGLVFKYLFGRLSLDEAFAYVSRRLNIVAKPVLIPIAEAAIDVDKPSDKALVERILNKGLT